MGSERKEGEGTGKVEREEQYPFLIILGTFQPPEKIPWVEPTVPLRQELGVKSVYLLLACLVPCHAFIPGFSNLAQETVSELRACPQTKMSELIAAEGSKKPPPFEFTCLRTGVPCAVPQKQNQSFCSLERLSRAFGEVLLGVEGSQCLFHDGSLW